MPSRHFRIYKVSDGLGRNGDATPDADSRKDTTLQQAAHGAGGYAAELAGGFLDGPEQRGHTATPTRAIRLCTALMNASSLAHSPAAMTPPNGVNTPAGQPLKVT